MSFSPIALLLDVAPGTVAQSGSLDPGRLVGCGGLEDATSDSEGGREAVQRIGEQLSPKLPEVGLVEDAAWIPWPEIISRFIVRTEDTAGRE